MKSLGSVSGGGRGVMALSVLFIIMTGHTWAQFVGGADIGWLSQMEAQGYVFKDSAGNAANCLDILRSNGITALRFRVWVNPSGYYCSRKDVATMALRAHTAGFDVLIDFHCSDTWADPGHQAKPAAWANDSLPKLLSDLYDHVYGVLDTLKTLGVVPKWVQIGNETNDGMLWEDGRASTHPANFAAMIRSGYNAVKAVDSSIQVIVHLSDGNNDSMYRNIFDGLKNNGAQWDIIGMSVYPYWANLPWATDDSLALVTMKDMISRYRTKVMVVETGYLYNQPVTANQFLLDLIAKTKLAGGLGVFYWEPECYNWQGYQLGAWDPSTEMPTAAMDAFIGRSATLVKDEPIVPGYRLAVYPNPFNPGTTIEYDLPVEGRVEIVVFNELGQIAARLVDSIEMAGHHSIAWGPKESASGVYYCRMISGSYVKTQKLVLLK